MNRKLQTEIDRTLKKVEEGIVQFNATLEKVYNASTTNQKDKYEQDLKKEIKKLQRYRDQIKTWIGSSDIKDKKLLMEARKNIEAQMERFRDCEKETKTKAYSKEGLQMQIKQTDKKDPNRKFINQSLKRLSTQINLFEAEIEQLALAKTGKKKKSLDQDALERTSQLEYLLERHQYHQDALEKILRMYDNEQVTEEQIQEIMPTMEDYLERCQEPDFYEDEEIYEAADITLPNLGSTSEALSMSASKDSQTDDLSSSRDQDEDKSISISTSRDSSSSKKGSKRDSLPFSTPLVSGSNPPLSASASSSKAKAAKAVPNVSASSIGAPAKGQKSDSRGRTLSSSTPPQVQLPSLSQRKEDSFANRAKNSGVMPIGGSYAGVASVSSKKDATETPSSVSSSHKQKFAQIQNITGAVATKTNQAASNPSLANGPPSSFPAASSASPSSSHANSSAKSTASAMVGGGKQQDRSKLPGTSPATEPASSTERLSSTSVVSSPSQRPENHITTATQQKEAEVAQAKAMADSNQMGREMMANGIDSSLKTSDMASDQHGFTLAMLEASMRRLPESGDSDRHKQYVPRSPCQTPPNYPQTPLPRFESAKTFEKFDTDTLFFIFYYQQGTYQQFLAAQELKTRSWRYHKKYLTWFQRHEEPKKITNDFEQGTYVYFDYETGWCQRKKTEFTFEYRYLEDGD